MMGGIENKPRWTWDGQPIASEPPFGATIIVYTFAQNHARFLILHRAHTVPEDRGDWSWTPPSGARLPDESVLAGAIRELHEETGLEVRLEQIDRGEAGWSLFAAQVEGEIAITMSAEHDQYEWVSLDEARKRCQPRMVGDAFLAAAQKLGLS